MRTLLAVSALAMMAVASVPDIQVKIVPTTAGHYELLKRSRPDAYLCTVTVTDPIAQRTLVYAEVVAKPGVPADVTRKSGDYEVQFHVDISKSVAKTKVVVRNGSDVVARQSSMVQLAQ